MTVVTFLYGNWIIDCTYVYFNFARENGISIVSINLILKYNHLVVFNQSIKFYLK